MEEMLSTDTALASPSTAEAGGGVMAELAETDQEQPPITGGLPDELQPRATEDPPLPETEAEAPSDGAVTHVAQDSEELSPDPAEAAEASTKAQGISADRESDGDKPPVAPTEDMQLQANSIVAAPEQPAAEQPSVATHHPDAATATAAAPVELLDPVDDSNLKPTSLSSQNEESIRAYLDNTVVPVLRDGLRMLVKERPEDPCNYLVDYIKAHHP